MESNWTITFDAIVDVLRDDLACPNFVWAHLRDVLDFKQMPYAKDSSSRTPTRLMAMAYWDGQLRLFLATLRTYGFDERCLIIVFSDHGSGPACSLQDHSLRVPLVFWSPQLEPLRIESMCGLWDLAPTVLVLTGLPPESSFQGSSILQLAGKQARLIFSEHAGRGPCDLDRKSINMAISNGSHKLLFSEMEDETGFSAKVDFNENVLAKVPRQPRLRFVEAFQQRCREIRAAPNRN